MSKLNEHYALIKRLCDEGKSDGDVAAALPIPSSAPSIARFRRLNGIAPRPRGGPSPLDPYEDDIRRMYVDEKLSDEQIAEALPITIGVEAVRLRRNRMGIKANRHKASGRFATEALYEQIKDQLPAAWERSKQWHSKQQRMVGSAERVGKEFGVGHSTAQTWLARHGLTEVKSAHGDDAPARAFALFREGLSVPRIAETMSVPRDTVNHWLNVAGVDLSGQHYTERMSPEEHRAWRDSIRIARAPAEVINSRFKYRGVPMDSTYEVRFAKHCDQIGLEWKRYDRTLEGALVEYGDGALYAPDFIIGLVYVETKGYYTPKDQAKVRAWRELKGHLSLVTHVELADFERITDANEAVNFLEACLHNDPDPEEDERA